MKVFDEKILEIIHDFPYESVRVCLITFRIWSIFLRTQKSFYFLSALLTHWSAVIVCAILFIKCIVYNYLILSIFKIFINFRLIF